MTEQEVRDRLRAAVEAAGGQRKFAEAHGFSVAYINDVLRGKRDLADRILATIGIERRATYQVVYQKRDDSEDDSSSDKPTHDDRIRKP